MDLDKIESILVDYALSVLTDGENAICVKDVVEEIASHVSQTEEHSEASTGAANHVLSAGTGDETAATNKEKSSSRLLAELLIAVNRVTAPHRHHAKIEKRDLDYLANTQIEVEDGIRRSRQ